MAKRKQRSQEVILIGPRLRGPVDAVWALDRSVEAIGGDCVALLLLDHEQRVLLAPTFEGADLLGAPKIVDVVLKGVAGSEVASIVIGAYLADGRTLPSEAELDVTRMCEERCDADGIELLDVFLIGLDDWRSVASVADRLRDELAGEK